MKRWIGWGIAVCLLSGCTPNEAEPKKPVQETKKEVSIPTFSTWMKQTGNTNGAMAHQPTKALTEANLAKKGIKKGSLLYSIATETGGISVQHGWLRILGSSSAIIPRDLLSWNEGKQTPGLLIADDVVGGFFAMTKQGSVLYLGPDTLEWEETGLTYEEFITWCMIGDMNTYYETLRWDGWENVSENVKGNQALSIYPFLWSEEYDRQTASREAVPIEETWGLTQEFIQQLSAS